MLKVLFYRVGQPALAFVVVAVVASLFSACELAPPTAMGPAIAKLNASAQQAMAQGNTATAVARLESARELAPNQPELSHNLAAAYLANNNFEQAAALFDQLVQKATSNDKQVAYLIQLAQAQQKHGDVAYDAFEAQKSEPLPEACKPALEPTALPTGQDRRVRNQPPVKLAQQASTAYTAASQAYNKVLLITSTDRNRAEETTTIQEILATLTERIQRLDVAKTSGLSGGRA